MGCMSSIELEWPAGWVCSNNKVAHARHHKTIECQTPRQQRIRRDDLQGSGGGGRLHHQQSSRHLDHSSHNVHAPPASPYHVKHTETGGGLVAGRGRRDADRYANDRTPRSSSPQNHRQDRHRARSRSRSVEDSYSRSRERDRDQGPRRRSMSRASDRRSTRSEKEGPVVLSTKYKLLLLGSGESGKSTFFKRMLIQYGRGYSDDERMDFRDSIYENTVEAMQTLLRECQESSEPEWEIHDNLKELAEEFCEIEDGEGLSRSVAEDLMKLWGDPGVRKAFDNRSTFDVPVPDGAQFFFDDVFRLARRDYCPTAEDVLRCRDRTIGVQSEKLKLATDELQAEFEIFDVGGQQGERKHWVKVFTGVHAVLFIVALSEFNMKCFEATELNRMQDSFDVFKMVANSKKLNVPILLIFNKVDLFLEKLEKGVKFDFHGYDGAQTFDDITDFLVDEFTSQCTRSDKAIMAHFTCAIERKFNADDLLTDVIDVNDE